LLSLSAVLLDFLPLSLLLLSDQLLLNYLVLLVQVGTILLLALLMITCRVLLLILSLDLLLGLLYRCFSLSLVLLDFSHFYSLVEFCILKQRRQALVQCLKIFNFRSLIIIYNVASIDLLLDFVDDVDLL
jgi:hypothetical protein